jgi:hypothetical protein
MLTKCYFLPKLKKLVQVGIPIFYRVSPSNSSPWQILLFCTTARNFFRDTSVSSVLDSDLVVGSHFLAGFGWLAVMVAIYGTLTTPPPETATFRRVVHY